MTQTMPNQAHNLKFDLVIREYNEEQVEINPGMPVKVKA